MTKRVRTTRRLEAWLKETSVPLFVLNAQRRLVFFNAGCEALTGWTGPDVLGQVCDFVTEADTASPGALLASLAPVADAWQGELTTVPAVVARREVGPLRCLIDFYPLTDREHRVQAVLGMIRPAPNLAMSDETPVSRRLHAELAALRHSLRQKFGGGTLIGLSPAMKRVLDQLQLAQQSSVPVLFIGEAGTGRESLARKVHYASTERAFVPLDARRLPADQLEATLRRLGEAQQVDVLQPGTVYLDNIDFVSRDVQRRLLGLIESKHPARPRVMAAATRPLEPLVESDNFLRDLHFAMTSLEIRIPPLRQRLEDLEPLAQFFLEEENRGSDRQVNGFEADVWQQFRRYHWPGNLGELRAVILEARQNCDGPSVTSSHLPFRFRTGVDGQSIGPATRKRAVALDPLLLQVEREQIELALSEARQNKAKAAELLGITRPRLYRRMEVLGIADNESELPTDEASS